MTQKSLQILTPVGRLVGGDAFKFNDKNMEGAPLMTKDGKPRKEYVILVAFPKTDAETLPTVNSIVGVARESFPTLFSGGHAPSPSDFAYKMVDGDSTVPNARGKIPREKEGYPGCWVLTFKSAFPPKVYNQNVEVISEEQSDYVKRGYWVRVQAMCRGNNSQTRPGVYLNHGMVQLVAYGEEISSGPDAREVFGKAAAIPAGASATPMAPSAMPAGGGAPGAVPGGVSGLPAGVPVVAPAPAAPGAVPVPQPGFGAVVPGAPGAAPPAPPPPAGPQTKPGLASYESFIAQGWTHELLVAHGHLA